MIGGYRVHKQAVSIFKQKILGYHRRYIKCRHSNSNYVNMILIVLRFHTLHTAIQWYRVDLEAFVLPEKTHGQT